MQAARPRTISQRRLVWLLWLALLLPVAQGVATWHGFSHAGLDAGSQTDGEQALHPTHCSLCLIAGAIDGGALPGKALSLPQTLARHELPQAAVSSVWLSSPPQAYRSRAPPPASH